MHHYRPISSNFKRWPTLKSLLTLVGFVSLSLCMATAAPAVALTSDQLKIMNQGIYYFNMEESGYCSLATQGIINTNLISGGGNRDYAGRPILTQGQIEAITENQPIYEQAAAQADIPWQMLAVIHLRESGLKRSNPSNGQGIYQFLNKQGGPYPTVSVNNTEFLRQSILAAQFIKNKVSANYTGNRHLTALTTDPNIIKDTFFSYNGRANAYTQQAQHLGFNPSTQGYEGSPYVMNVADANRDPSVNTATWGQIKTDGGALSYPANADYGAFVEYAALTGLPINGSCGGGNINGTVRQKAVALAQQEYSLWDSGSLKPGIDGYSKYSQGVDELWCADFISWIYNQAGYSLNPNGNWRIPGVIGIQEIGQKNKNFHWHSADSNYKPKVGDIVVHLENGESHVNMVVGISNNSMTLIGGDQSPDGRGYPDGSRVSQYTVIGFNGVDNITGYVSPD